MGHRIAKRNQRIDRIGHGRVDGPQPAFTLHPVQQPRLGFLHRPGAKKTKGIFLIDFEKAVNPHKHVAPTEDAAVFLKRRRRSIVHAPPRHVEQFFNPLLRRNPARSTMGKDNEQGHNHGPGPIRDRVEMKIKPLGHEHDFGRHTGHAAPIVLSEQRQRNFRKHVGRHDAPCVKDRASGSTHVRIILRNAGQLQRKVGFDRGTDVHRTAEINRPPAVFELSISKIADHVGFPILVDRADVAAQHHILRGQRGIGFQLLNPIPFLTLSLKQPGRTPRQGFFQGFGVAHGRVGIGRAGGVTNHGRIIRDEFQRRVRPFVRRREAGRGGNTLGQSSQKISESFHV